MRSKNGNDECDHTTFHICMESPKINHTNDKNGLFIKRWSYLDVCVAKHKVSCLHYTLDYLTSESVTDLNIKENARNLKDTRKQALMHGAFHC